MIASRGHDLRTPLRAGASDVELAAIIGTVWRGRADRYSEIRATVQPREPKAEMSLLGG